MGADHGGFALKEELGSWLTGLGHEVVDAGAFSLDPLDDYPEFSEAVGKSVADGAVDRGVLICGSGVGACIAANKIRGVRACLCHDVYSAHQGVEHDDMNVICLGARVIAGELARDLLTAFLVAEFRHEERFVRRLEKVAELEKRDMTLATGEDER